MDLHPILAALFRELPPVGSEWPVEDRVRWMRAATAAVDLIYKDDEAARITVEPVTPPHHNPEEG
jgi:hypothetical protein